MPGPSTTSQAWLPATLRHPPQRPDQLHAPRGRGPYRHRAVDLAQDPGHRSRPGRADADKRSHPGRHRRAAARRTPEGKVLSLTQFA